MSTRLINALKSCVANPDAIDNETAEEFALEMFTDAFGEDEFLAMSESQKILTFNTFAAFRYMSNRSKI